MKLYNFAYLFPEENPEMKMRTSGYQMTFMNREERDTGWNKRSELAWRGTSNTGNHYRAPPSDSMVRTGQSLRDVPRMCIHIDKFAISLFQIRMPRSPSRAAEQRKLRTVEGPLFPADLGRPINDILGPDETTADRADSLEMRSGVSAPPIGVGPLNLPDRTREKSLALRGRAGTCAASERETHQSSLKSRHRTEGRKTPATSPLFLFKPDACYNISSFRSVKHWVRVFHQCSAIHLHTAKRARSDAYRVKTKEHVRPGESLLGRHSATANASAKARQCATARRTEGQ